MRTRSRIAMFLTIGAALLPSQVIVAGPPAPRPAAAPTAQSADRKEFDARAAQLEIGQRIPAILTVLAAPPGRTVATFGLARPEFLESLLKGLGPGGRAVSIHRSYSSYQAEVERVPPWGARVESIFAADGDAHLEPSSVALVVAQEVDGFYTRQQDLWRQAWQALQPDGRLILIRYPPTPPRPSSSSSKSGPPKPPASDFAERLAANREVVAMQRAGFRWIDSPKVLTHWVVEVYQRIEAPPATPVDASAGSGRP